jgi:hypothetical protein
LQEVTSVGNPLRGAGMDGVLENTEKEDTGGHGGQGKKLHGRKGMVLCVCEELRLVESCLVENSKFNIVCV